MSTMQRLHNMSVHREIWKVSPYLSYLKNCDEDLYSDELKSAASEI